MPSLSAPADPAAARRYATIRYRLTLLDLAVGLLFLVGLQWSGVSERLARWWEMRTASQPLILLGYLAVVGPLDYVLMLPLHVYRSFVLEHRFGLSRMTVRAWLIREAKQMALSVALSLALVEAWYALLRRAPQAWPLWATAGWVVVSVVLARAFPTLLLPIFYKTVPLEREELTARLLALCRRAGLPALGVFRFHLGAETRKANAALAGLGATRRVLVSDTLLEAFTPDEVEGVLGHELGHHRFHHIRSMLILSALGAWVGFQLIAGIGARQVQALGLRGLADVAAFPVLMLWLSLLGLLSLPLQNGISRLLEWQADRYAVDLTGRAHAFADALRRLGALNLADPSPPRWVVWFFYDHPPITERITAAAARAPQPLGNHGG